MERTEQEFLQAVYRFFGLNEALRSDQSYEALAEQIKAALNNWTARPANELWVRWTFADRVIATAWTMKPTGGEEHHAWEIPYSRGEAGDVVFGTPVEVSQVQLFEPVTESQKPGRGQRQRIIESSSVTLSVIGESATGGKKVKAIGITAGIVNGNGRRYPRQVLADAVQRLNAKLNESAGQGRLLLTGEAEHPSDKGGKANILETVFKWDAVSLNAAGQVVLEGAIIPTAKGKDLQIIAESGVPIKLSQRGYGEMQTIKENGQSINEVTYLEITGYDAVANPSDPTAGLTESQQPQEKNKTMNLEELLKLLKEQPETLKALMESLGLTQKNELAEALGVKPDHLKRAIQEAADAKARLAEIEQATAIDKAINEACEDLPYDDATNKRFVEAIRTAKPAKPEAVAALVEAKRVEWDGLLAEQTLVAMGRTTKPKPGQKVPGTFVERVAPVFESQTSQPEYTRPAFMLNESIVESGAGKRRDLFKSDVQSEVFARKVLQRYDQFYRAQLIAESKLFEEAEQTSDLNLPYTVSRAIIEQAFPELIAPNVFDFGVMQNSPERLYFEQHVGETGAVVVITDEVVAGDHDVWVSLNQKRIRPGSVVLTNSGGGTTYTYGVDYIIDHVEGRIKTLSTGSTTDSQSLKIDYTYDAIRKGEMGTIERAKNQLTYITINAAADRLAIQISNEAILFSRSQLGYDAVGRTLANLIRDVRRRIDANILWAALNAALAQPNNSGGTWNSGSDPVAQFVQKLGVAKVKVENRFYTPTAQLMSKTNADRLSNWDGFMRDGFPNAVLNAAGYAGSVKGLPIFASSEFPDTHALVTNRELVMHRVYQPMMLKGPFPSFSSDKLVGADQYYAEEYNSTETPVVEKAAYMVIS